MPNNVETITQLHSFHTLAKWCSKFSKPGFNSTWTEIFQMFTLYLEKTVEPEIKLPTSIGPSKKEEISRKKHLLCFIDYTKAFDYVNHSKLWKILKEMGTSRPKRNIKRYTFQGPRTIFLGSLEHVVWQEC